MSNLTLEININSACNLVNVNLMSKMEVYAVITLHGDATRKKHNVKTAVDRSGGSNPTWNHTVKFSFNERLAHDGSLTLVIRLVSRRVLGNKDIGRINVPLLELLHIITPSINGDGNVQGMKFVTYQVKSPSGKRKGSLTFSYRFNSDFPAIVNRRSLDPADVPSTAYPPPSKSVSLPSQIEHPPSASLASVIKYTKLPQPPHPNDSDHQTHCVAAGSSYEALPVSYDAAVTDSPYFWSPPSHKSSYAYHHAPPSPPPPPPPPPTSLPPQPPLPPPPPQLSRAYFPSTPPSQQGYDYAPPSPAGYGSPSSQPPKGIGLGLGMGAGLLGGLMMGDLVSDVVNSFDL